MGTQLTVLFTLLISLLNYSSAQYQLSTLTVNATVGYDLVFTCSATSTIVAFQQTGSTLTCVITGFNTDQTCIFAGSYITDYQYRCFPTNTTAMITIPGSLVNGTLHGTTWECFDPYDIAGSLSQKVIYVNVPISTAIITSTPEDINPVAVVEGSIQNLVCTTNAGRPHSTIDWYRSNDRIPSSDRSLQITCNTDCSDDMVISTSTLQYTGNRTDSGKIIYCKAMNIVGQDGIRSENKTLNVLYGPTEVELTPAATSYKVTEGRHFDPIVCSVHCNPNCTVTWTGPYIPPGTTSTLNLQTVNRSYAGNYNCTANNSIGSQTVTIHVDVNYGPRVASISPETITYTVTENTDKVQIICSADCKPNCTMTWTGPNLPPGTTSGLKLNNIDRNQAGSYYCTARNNIGTRKSAIIQIIVYYAPDTTPMVQQTPEGPITPCNKVTLTCTLSGGHPLPVLSWDCDGTTTNNTSGNTVSFSVEFTVDTPHNTPKICNCSATHLVPTYRPTVHHELEAYCLPQSMEIQDGRGLFIAGISSLVTSLIILIITVLINYWRFRKMKTSKSSDNYTDFNTKRITETAEYDVINQTTNIGTSRAAEKDKDKGGSSYEELQPSSKTEPGYLDLGQEPKGSPKMKAEEYDYVKV